MNDLPPSVEREIERLEFEYADGLSVPEFVGKLRELASFVIFQRGELIEATRYRWWVKKYFGSEEDIDRLNSLKAEDPEQWGHAIDSAIAEDRR